MKHAASAPSWTGIIGRSAPGCACACWTRSWSVGDCMQTTSAGSSAVRPRVPISMWCAGPSNVVVLRLPRLMEGVPAMTMSPGDSRRRDLLIAIFGEDAESLAAWGRWQRHTDIESLSRSEFGLQPALSRRLESHGITHPWLARLRGVHRYCWTANQLTRRDVQAVFSALERCGRGRGGSGGTAVDRATVPRPRRTSCRSGGRARAPRSDRDRPRDADVARVDTALAAAAGHAALRERTDHVRPGGAPSGAAALALRPRASLRHDEPCHLLPPETRAVRRCPGADAR